MLRPLLCGAVLLGLAHHRPALAGPDDDAASAAFFAGGSIPDLRIRVEPARLDRLRADPRAYVEATIEEAGRPPIGPVGLKLKGAAGSFRGWDDRPALTLNTGKFGSKARFHGLRKFQLNNSVQDGTLLSEALCADLFHRAGYPAPRVAYAQVTLNDRNVGLYVLKEGFDRDFLARSFPDPAGNLYDGGFCRDIDADLEKDEGDGPDDRRDLEALAAASRETDPDRRRERLGALLDVDAFCTFMALERMAGHWDGYSNKANNYRVYFDPRDGRATFLPHGMDQMFEDPGMGLFDPTGALIAGAILNTPDFRRRYRAALARVVPLMDPPDALLARVDEVVARIQPVLRVVDPGRGNDHPESVAALKERLRARAANLRGQLAADSPLAFEGDGVAPLAIGWMARVETGRGAFGTGAEGDGPATIRIGADAEGQPTIASWRRRVILAPGDYTLHADVRVDGVVPIPATDRGFGVGIGRSGTPRTQHRVGTGAWEPMTCRFTVADAESPVELVLEIRATRGTALFDQGSLRLVREPAPTGR